MVNFKDFEKPDGSVDWPAYTRAQVEAGEVCSSCGHILVFARGHRDLCAGCASVDQDDELRHHSRVRCPKCRRVWDPGRSDDYELFGEGEHEVTCGECGHDFTVSTYVQHTFTSPPVLPVEKKTDAP